MKTVRIEGRVQDLTGLYIALRRALFDVKNVGAGPASTFIYLDDAEERDPSEIAASWVGKPPMRMQTPIQHKNLIGEFETLPDLVDAKMEVDPAPSPATPEVAEKKSFLRSIFRRIT